jgi:DNA-binding NarL/FixJ family response regulator
VEIMAKAVLGRPKSEKALRILLIDKHNIYRAGLRSVLSERTPCAEVFESGGIAEGLSQLSSIGSLDLVLVDLDLSCFRSIDLLKHAFAAHPKTRFAIISGADSRESILASLSAGFHGFISKHQLAGDVLDAINDIASGRIYVPPALARPEIKGVLESNGEGSRPMIASEAAVLRLTPRQREVLSHLALGKSNKEIGRALHIAEATAKVHTGALLRVLGARNRTEVAFKARRLLESLGGFPPLGPSATAPAIDQEKERVLKLRVMEARAAVETSSPRRKSF